MEHVGWVKEIEKVGRLAMLWGPFPCIAGRRADQPERIQIPKLIQSRVTLVALRPSLEYSALGPLPLLINFFSQDCTWKLPLSKATIEQMLLLVIRCRVNSESAWDPQIDPIPGHAGRTTARYKLLSSWIFGFRFRSTAFVDSNSYYVYSKKIVLESCQCLPDKALNKCKRTKRI